MADGWCVDRSINQSVDIDDVFVTIRICPDRPLLCQPAATHVLLCTLRATLEHATVAHGPTTVRTGLLVSF